MGWGRRATTPDGWILAHNLVSPKAARGFRAFWVPRDPKRWAYSEAGSRFRPARATVSVVVFRCGLRFLLLFRQPHGSLSPASAGLFVVLKKSGGFRAPGFNEIRRLAIVARAAFRDGEWGRLRRRECGMDYGMIGRSVE